MWRARWLVVVLVVAAPGVVAAHHPVSESGAAPVAPATTAELEVGLGRFDRADGAGRFEVVMPRLELAVTPWLGLGVCVPLVRVNWDDGHEDRGAGDLELTARVTLWRAPHEGAALVAGLGVELPTGDEGARLGGGHVELSPFLLGAAAWERGGGLWVVTGYVGARASVFDVEAADDALQRTPRHGPAAGEVHGAAYAPHTDVELVGRLGGLVVRGPWFAGVGGEVDQPLAGGATVVGARGEAGRRFGAWRVVMSGDGDVLGEARTDWRVRVGLSRRF
jgi:hypothetical protein